MWPCRCRSSNRPAAIFWDCGWWNRAIEVQEWIKQAVKQAASGVVFRGDSRYFWADRSEHVVDFACLPIRDVEGKVVLLVATGMDITERVQSEQYRRALEVERQRAEALSELDRAKIAFFSNVSHEFRTPLTLSFSDRTKWPLPFLILLDLKMPGLSGHEVLKWVRARPETCRIPVIVITSPRQKSDIHRAYILGANGYLVKPGTPTELLTMVEGIKNYWLTQNRTPGPS